MFSTKFSTLTKKNKKKNRRKTHTEKSRRVVSTTLPGTTFRVLGSIQLASTILLILPLALNVCLCRTLMPIVVCRLGESELLILFYSFTDRHLSILGLSRVNYPVFEL